jgi:hypothetical protein
MSAIATMAGHPTQCIFCNGKSLNEEHVLGKWSKPFVPRTIPNYKQLQALQHLTHSDFKVRRRAGDPRSLKVTCVCYDCNSGWMSDIQNTMKPLGISMCAGKTIKLDPKSQLAVATWAAMVAMTAEYDHPPTVAIPQGEKDFFYKNKYPSPSFRIWLGHLPPNTWGTKWVHHPLAILEEEPGSPHAALANLNSVTSTHVLGQLLFHIMSVPWPEILRGWSFPNSVSGKLIQIWPMIHGDVFWPPLKSLDAQSASITAGSFLEFSVRSRRRSRIARGLNPDTW